MENARSDASLARASRHRRPLQGTGRAKYSYDINVRAAARDHAAQPHAHAKIKSLDTADARRSRLQGDLRRRQGGKELFYAGDEVLAIACDTRSTLRTRSER